MRNTTIETVGAEGLETPRQIGRRINTTPATVLNLYRAGKIPAEIAVGRIYRFDPAKVLDALRKASKGGAK